MQTIDQLIHSKWLITGEPKQPVLENQTLAIQNGKILEILSRENASKKYSAKQNLEYATHAVLPGFINAHTHLAMNYFRGFADDLALMNWLNNFIWPAERKWVSHEFVRDASLLAMAEMIRCGTTCYNDMYFFLQATAEATEIAGLRGSIGITVINFPTAWAKDVDEYFAKGLEFLEQYKNHDKINITMAPQGIYTVEEKSLVRIKELADQHKIKINMHVQETADEVNQSLQQTGLRPIKRLQDIGYISPQLIAVHMTQINEEDLEILAQGKPHIVHCPESNMKLASGACPVEQFQKIGLNVALGTDGAASNNDLDMMSEMRSAAFLSKLVTKNPESLSAQEAITLATLNGAKALGIEQVTGSLKAGKSADFIAVKLDEIETQPLYHPESHLVYAASRQQVTDVWVAGKQLMKNRQLTTLDEKELIAKAQYWRQKIRV